MGDSKSFANVLRLAVLSAMVASQPARGTETDALRVGVAKVDITPSNLTHLNPMGYGTQTGVHDPIFARALVVDNGKTSVAIVSLDLIETGDTLQLRERIQKGLGFPVNHIVITASHDHSAPRLGEPSPGSLTKHGGPEVDAFTANTYEKIVAALKQAKASMQPARLGLGIGRADVSVNRDQFTQQGWKLGYDPDGVSDKTVWVLKFESTSGAPIALLFNYAVHSTVTTSAGVLSGDLAGTAERYVEHHYGDKLVALWTLGPAGDQNPKFAGSGTERSGPPPTDGGPGPQGGATGREGGGGSPQGNASDPNRDSGAIFEAMDAQGFMVGAEVVRVASLIQPKIAAANLDADELVITCPMRDGIDKLATYHASPTGTVPIRLGVVIIGDIALTTVSGEVVTNIYTRLKRESPLTNTILVTLTNDRIGYFVDDMAYPLGTFEVLATPAAAGCAEKGIVNGLVEMIKAHR